MHIVDLVFVLARIMLASYFVLGTYHDVSMREELWKLMRSRKIPNYEILYYCAIALKIIAGLAIIINIYLPFAAGALFIFTGIANVLFNNFWRAEPGPKKTFSEIRFMSHIAVMGGLLLLMIH